MRRGNPNTIIHLLVRKDDWNVVEQIDGWLYVYDNMPPQMRLCVDMRMMGYTPKEIAGKTGIIHNQVCNQLRIAKERFTKVLI